MISFERYYMHITALSVVLLLAIYHEHDLLQGVLVSK